MNQKTALITGITGMDGSHLADLLLSKNYKIYGIVRRTSTNHHPNIQHLLDKVELITADLTDQNSLFRAILQSRPDEIYNLAAQSFVHSSFNIPEQTIDVNATGVLRILESIREYERIHPYSTGIKLYQASTSEMYGDVKETPQTETTPFNPRSPYAVAKQFSYYLTGNYREAYNMFICNGILFNHEGERRGIEFVTRKISDGVAQIKLGLADHITLGNLDAKRDWGYAPDYVEAMWLMMQQNTPDDYVIATGEVHSIRDFLDIAFKHIGINDWSSYIKQDPKFMRKTDVHYLQGDSTKARTQLNWKPKVSFKELVERMVDNDIKKHTVSLS